MDEIYPPKRKIKLVQYTKSREGTTVQHTTPIGKPSFYIFCISKRKASYLNDQKNEIPVEYKALK